MCTMFMELSSKSKSFFFLFGNVHECESQSNKHFIYPICVFTYLANCMLCVLIVIVHTIINL